MQHLRILLLLAVVAVTLVRARGPGQFTAPGCGPNSRPDSCSDGCVPTCNKDEKCTPAFDGCVPECVCHRGYVRSPTGFGCIQESECQNYP